MSVLATDNFNRADSGTLGANWTKDSHFSDLRITSNQCKASVSSPDCVDSYTAVTFPADQYSKVVLATASTDGGPTVRSDTAGTFYLLDTSSSAYAVFKCLTGSFTQLNSVGVTPTSGDTAYIEAQGTAILTKQNTTTRNNITDSAIASGASAGLHASGATIIYDNWEGGDFAGATTTTIQPGTMLREA